MQNPIDLLGVHPSGAHQRREDNRDYPWDPKEIAQAGVPFDWHTGYDVEADIAQQLGTGFQLATKNQGQSGSCGGQAFSAYAQALSAYYPHVPDERSAKYPYSQVFVGNPDTGGGSSDRELAKIYTRQGIATEATCSSYENGAPPTEAFMERANDITAHARLNAAGDKIVSAYAFPQINIDTIAQAMSASKGLVMGLHGSNNGTWLSAEPRPPVSGETLWSHYMYFGKAFMENGVKKIWGKQSWGPSVGMGGWQKLDEAYFNSGAIWGALTLVYNPQVTAPPQHTFNADLHFKDNSPEITALQQLLAYDGELNVAPTGYYGQITEQAVLRFQIKYKLASLATLAELGGSVVGPATRAKLNTLTQ